MLKSFSKILFYEKQVRKFILSSDTSYEYIFRYFAYLCQQALLLQEVNSSGNRDIISHDENIDDSIHQ